MIKVILKEHFQNYTNEHLVNYTKEHFQNYTNEYQELIENISDDLHVDNLVSGSNTYHGGSFNH